MSVYTLRKIEAKKIINFLTGLSCAMLMVLPSYRPANIPISYLVVLLVFVGCLFTKPRVFTCAMNVLLMWVLLALYTFCHAVLFGSASAIRILVRNGIGIIAAILVTMMIKDIDDLGFFILGMALIMIMDEIVALGQFLGMRRAFVCSKYFNTWAMTLEKLDIVMARLPSIRVFGLNGFPHLFAYNQGIWTVLLMWSSCFKNRKRGFALVLSFFLILSICSCILSGQRSVVWFLAISFVLIYTPCLGLKRCTKLIIPTLPLLVAMITFLLFSNSGISIRRLSDFSIASQSARISTWQQAIEVISLYPLKGNIGAYYNVLGVHNALLNGWVHFGFVWVLLFLGSWIVTARLTLFTGPAKVTFMVIGFFMIPIGNMMFHTLTPGFNDISFFVALGLLLVLCRLSKRVDKTRFFHGISNKDFENLKAGGI